MLGLALRPEQSSAPIIVDTARAVAGHGLEGDRHADPRSPRQLLIAGRPAYDALKLPPLLLRENLLLDIDTAGLESGMLLRVGEGTVLRLTFQCEACGYLAEKLGGPVRALAQRRGILARVEAGGTIRVGDEVVILDQRGPALPEDWRDRVAMVLDAVPSGMVITYADLARVAGVQASYCRAFPRVLAKLGSGRAERAVSARSADPSPRWDGASYHTPMSSQREHCDSPGACQADQ